MTTTMTTEKKRLNQKKSKEKRRKKVPVAVTTQPFIIHRWCIYKISSSSPIFFFQYVWSSSIQILFDIFANSAQAQNTYVWNPLFVHLIIVYVKIERAINNKSKATKIIKSPFASPYFSCVSYRIVCVYCMCTYEIGSCFFFTPPILLFFINMILTISSF